MHHQRMWASSLAVIPQTLSLPPALGLKRERTEGKKREVLHLLRCYTHIYIYTVTPSAAYIITSTLLFYVLDYLRTKYSLVYLLTT